VSEPMVFHVFFLLNKKKSAKSGLKNFKILCQVQFQMEIQN